MWKSSMRGTGNRSFARASLIIIAVFLLGIPSVFAQPNFVTGVVFRDYDASGTRGADEVGVGGVTITAYNAAGAVVGTATSLPACTGAGAPVAACTGAGTPAIGSYNLGIGATTDVRIEFTGIPTGSQSGVFGTLSGTSVQFVAAGGIANFGINNRSDYCQADPRLSASCFVVGDNSGSVLPVVVSYPYSTNAAQPLPAEVTISAANEAGTVYGIAWQSTTRSLYSSAYVKRGAGLGIGNSTGTIYRMENADAATPGATSVFIELNGLGGIATGANPHPNGTPAGVFEQGTLSFQGIGLTGLGDLEINDNEDTLYTVNLNQRTLIVIPINNAGAVPVAVPGSVISIPVPVPSDCPVDYRPFGLGYFEGSLYLGMVCSGASTLTPAIDTWAEVEPLLASLRGYVYRFDPATNAFDGAPLLNFPLNYPRQFVNDGFPDPVPATANNENDGEWLPWTNVWRPGYIPTAPGGGINDTIANPQPMLTDIEFDGQGFMMLGFRDRFADQSYSNDDFNPFVPQGAPFVFSRQGGDILLACQGAGGAWSLENNGTCGTRTSTSAQTFAGPGGDEFYHEELFLPFHNETSLGSIALLPGRNELVSTVYDTYTTFEAGTTTFSNITGERVRAAQLLAPNSGFGKGGGLGDIELLCAAPPIEIGNRVWFDNNANGVQDPDDPPIAGVRVELRSSVAGAPAGLISFVTTDANGSYYFSSGPGTDSPNADYSIAALTPNSSFFVVIPSGQTPLAGIFITEANDVVASPSGSDLNDSDGTAIGVFVSGVQLTTGGPGANNHTYDFGFTQLPVAVTQTPPPQGPGAGGDPGIVSDDPLARVTRLPALGETPWWRIPALIGGGVLLIGAGLVAARRMRKARA